MQMEVEQFAEQLIGGLTEDCWSTIVRFMDAGCNSLFIYEQLITPAMRYIGTLWEQNLLTVAEEHLASGICDFLLTRYRSVKNCQPFNGKKAMFFCLEGETHYLGLKMVAALFEEYGWNVRNYGASLPLEYACIGGNNWKPDLIGVSVSIVYHLPKLKEYTDVLAKLPHQPTILVGGRLVGRYDMSQLIPRENTLAVADLVQLNEWLAWESGERRHQTSMGHNQYVRS